MADRMAVADYDDSLFGKALEYGMRAAEPGYAEHQSSMRHVAQQFWEAWCGVDDLDSDWWKKMKRNRL